MQLGDYQAFRGGITGHSPMGGCLAVPIDHTQKHGATLLPLYIPQQYAVAEQKKTVDERYCSENPIPEQKWLQPLRNGQF